MIKRPDTNAQRIKRHKRVRAKISGTPERPRLNVFRSEKNIYAQIIDDVAGNTLVAASSLDKEIEGNAAAAKPFCRAGGKLIAERAKAGIGVIRVRPRRFTCTMVVLLGWPKAPVRRSGIQNSRNAQI